MKKYAPLLFSFIFACLIHAGCASLPEPNDKRQTLVVGEFSQFGRGHGMKSLNGLHKNDIQIKIGRVSKGRTYTLKTNEAGLFFSAKIPDGIYDIRQIRLNKPKNESGTYLKFDAAAYRFDYTFKVENGKVNNLGSLIWNSGGGGLAILGYNNGGDHSQVKSDFYRENPLSNWNQGDWIEVSISDIQ